MAFLSRRCASCAHATRNANEALVIYLAGGVDVPLVAPGSISAKRKTIVGQIHISVISTGLQITPQTPGGNEQALDDSFHHPRPIVLLQHYCSMVSQSAFLGLTPHLKLFTTQANTQAVTDAVRVAVVKGHGSPETQHWLGSSIQLLSCILRHDFPLS